MESRSGAPGLDSPGVPLRVAAFEGDGSKRPSFPEDMLLDPLVQEAWNNYWQPYIAAGGDPAQAPADAVDHFWKKVLPEMAHDPALPQITREVWRTQYLKGQSKRASEEISLVARIEEVWGDGLSLLDELIHSVDLLLQFNEWRARLHARAEPPEWTARAQLVLLARAVQTAREVWVLLRSGYAAGGLGRWRTLHEISVVSRFIDQCGDGVAEPYLYHDEMQMLRVLQAYERYSHTWAAHQRSKETKKVQEERVRTLVARFGPLFKSDFGWAVTGFPSRTFKYPGPSLADLEDAVKMCDARPIYTKANHVVHASVRGFTDNPGHEKWPAKQLLSGASVYGMFEAGFWTARSLVTAAAASIGRWPLPSQVTHLAAMMSLRDEVVNTFFKAKQRLPSPLAALGGEPGGGE